MQDKTFVPFTKEMKRDYTILVPNMLPMHFKLIMSVLETYGYKTELLETYGREIIDTGLKYTHNDACYPAVLVVGQFMQALLSGKYDVNKTALIMFQTGGGCRASNYISLIRKALEKAGLSHIPVISFSLAGIEKHPGFKMSLPIYHSMLYAVLYGDLMMSLANQVKTYEINSGDAQRLCDKWTAKLARELGSGRRISYRRIKKNYRALIDSFAEIPVKKFDAVQVGIVGEIFVKYSPLANNKLESFLVSQGAEVNVPGLLDFCLFSIYNSAIEYKMYGRKLFFSFIARIGYDLMCNKKNDVIKAVEHDGRFRAWTPFERVTKIGADYISCGAKMGEGWLLTAEMLELAESGCKNIVCTQPFGCLPNHICGKGMMKPIKENNPDVNIVAIDYDASASRVNQENRLKLMLFNAQKNKENSSSTTNKAVL